MFINFAALTIVSELIKRMRMANLFRKYTVSELLAESRRIKYTKETDEIIISKISNRKD